MFEKNGALYQMIVARCQRGQLNGRWGRGDILKLKFDVVVILAVLSGIDNNAHCIVFNLFVIVFNKDSNEETDYKSN